ncbi:uncharacterized protein LOC122289229 [Carya illinoinensis]|uniref:uncharacterized protein LOC122289229 n=1 Tax=Carya illinoinensis TaxID=32201 RepID=UPI001C71F3D9|nr:uncharacterized protein LOC122289229 [Carya illinoinensis]
MGQTSKASTQQGPWSSLWSLNIPNATKVFLWRACLNALPTRANLKVRKVVEDTACPICSQPSETIEHVLWECPSARDVWSMSSRKFQKASIGSFSLVEKLEGLVESKETKELQTFAKLSVSKRAGVLKQQINQAWEAPSQGKIKVNWDASVDKVACKVGVGVILRDWNSSVLATLRMEQDLFPDPHMAEAFAVQQAILFCKSLGHWDVVLEGDSLLVVEGLKAKSNTLNYVGQIVADTKEILNTFRSWSVRHVVRATNVVAHALSRDAFRISGQTTTFVHIPPCIQTMVT